MLGAIVLAGGLSSRYGKNKALIELNGKPLVRYVVDSCQTVAGRIITVIGKDSDPQSYRCILPSNVELISERERRNNPLNGIAAGIEGLDTTYTLVLACDMPFIKSKILELLLARATGFDAAVPVWPNGYLEPLHSVYSVEAIRRVLPSILKNKNSRVSDLIHSFETIRYVETEEIRKYDPQMMCFFNVNDFEGLKIAKSMLEFVTTSIRV
jgi:molybdopterin-guanine dinucleotide biosynthesis protein A